MTTDNQNILESGKYTVLHTGKAIDDFLKRVTMAETRIGEYETTGKMSEKKSPELIVSGHMLSSLEEATWILTEIKKTTLDATPRFKRVFEKNAIQIITQYYATMNLSESEKQEAITKINQLNSNKLIVIPFKPGVTCSVEIQLEEHKVTKELQIDSIKWYTDPQKFKLKCDLLFSNKKSLDQRVYKIPITDYLDKFKVTSMNMQGKTSKVDKKLIEVTDYGIFKPIEFNDGDNIVAIDGTYVYHVHNGTTNIIGTWRNDDIHISTVLNCKAYRKLMKNIDAIMAHRRYIAPYNTFDTVVVEA